MIKEQIKHMVDRFLGWKLPENFNPDGGISFKKTFNEHTDHPMKHEPSGTNLLDAMQAEEMVRYMIEGMPEEAVNPTKQHTQKCPKLSGGECTCDGYHTFDELYDHRITLYIALCRHKHELYAIENPGKHKVWRSKKHSDGSEWDGWFILGIGTEKGKQITYHIPVERWDETEHFAETLEKAPDWDGHTSADVIERIKAL